MSQKIDPHRFRIALFGSARIKYNDPRYRLVYNLSKRIAEEGIDIVTGGGPSLMNAANRGHFAGRKESRSRSIGLTIKLPKTQRKSYHLDMVKDFDKFSSRLDTFMELSNVVVVAPGGIGTLLELFYTWQLVQVKYIKEVPIILLGDSWGGLIEWMREKVMKKRLMSSEDFSFLYVANTLDEAIKLIMKFHEGFKSGKK